MRLGFFALESGLLAVVREFGRVLLEAVLNAFEPDDPASLPRDLWFQASGYRRREKKTRNAHVATLLGTIVLWRRGYRSWDQGERAIFPLEMLLGLSESVSPALADWLGRAMAEAGATQDRVLARLKQECGVAMGVQRLRACLEKLSEALSPLRQAQQVDVLLDALKQAQTSRGNRQPVLSVGRDGITLREYTHRCFEVATAATVSIYDRAGQRLTTVYLAWPPELGQATMDKLLTALLTELFARWEGPLPRLAYVADAGSHESGYFDRVLRHLRHPRTKKRLKWTRVVDFFHAAERVWSMAEALFGSGTREGHAWARRMLKLLKKPGGPSRVLHSAAALFHRRALSKTRTADFWKAYRYLQKRTKQMRYAQYASLHIPLGSGVTEAACKTLFTQRLKLSGMRWSRRGAQTILSLRMILLSGTWQATFAVHLNNLYPTELQPYAAAHQNPANIAA